MLVYYFKQFYWKKLYLNDIRNIFMYTFSYFYGGD